MVFMRNSLEITSLLDLQSKLPGCPRMYFLKLSALQGMSVFNFRGIFVRQPTQVCPLQPLISFDKPEHLAMTVNMRILIPLFPWELAACSSGHILISIALQCCDPAPILSLLIGFIGQISSFQQVRYRDLFLILTPVDMTE